MNYIYTLIMAYISIFIICYYVGLVGDRYKKSIKWIIPKIIHNKLTKYNWVVSHPENINIGKHVDIGAFTYIQAEHHVSIGNNTQIGAHCAIYSKNTIDKTQGSIIIGNNACIGAGTIILPRKDNLPLIIVDNVKIGALSLIKDSILETGTYVGIPIKKIKENKYESGL